MININTSNFIKLYIYKIFYPYINNKNNKNSNNNNYNYIFCLIVFILFEFIFKNIVIIRNKYI